VGGTVTLLLVYVGFALGISFICSLLEATLLSTRIASLAALSASGNKGATKLRALKQDRIDDAISAILTLNTVANTLGATLAGAQAADYFGSRWVGVFSGVLTFLILIVSEIIPKTLGAVYSRSLSGIVGHTLLALTVAMTPVLLVSRGITRVLTRGRKLTVSRGELSALIEAATHDGTISDEEARLFANLLRSNAVQVEDVMTPRTVTMMLPIDTTIEDLLKRSDADAFSRIPLYKDSRDNVVGYVLQRDVWQAVARSGKRSSLLSEYMRPISFVPELAAVGAALQQMLARRESIAIATDEYGGVAGLVTLEDITETILGVEIVDESDRVVDMRDTAMRLREARLERTRHLQDKSDSGTDGIPS
jgi:CBS domain containing-hemolysin-like protein